MLALRSKVWKFMESNPKDDFREEFTRGIKNEEDRNGSVENNEKF